MRRLSNARLRNPRTPPHGPSAQDAEGHPRQGAPAPVMEGRHPPSEGESAVHRAALTGKVKDSAFDRPIRTTRAGGWIPVLLDLLRLARDALPKGETRVRDLLAQAAALIHSSTRTGAEATSLADRCFRSAGLTRWQADRVDEYIDAHVRETIRMSSLATVTKLSTSYFFHAFRATFGESPYRYVVRRRIELAKGLMMAGDRTLADIALDCGFADQPHMTRQFRQLVGVPPAVWRRAGRMSQDAGQSVGEDAQREAALLP